jgi:ribose transport system permease protein
MIVFFSFVSRSFLTPDNLFSMLRQIAILMIAAFGTTYLMISGGIDLTLGSNLALTGIACTYAIVFWHWPIWLGVLLGIGVGASVGLVNALIVTKVKIAPIITTLGMLQVVRGLALLWSNGRPIYFDNPAFLAIGRGDVWVIPIPVLLAVVVFFVLMVLLNRTYIGTYIYAIGGNKEAAWLSGINISAVQFFLFILSGFLAGIGGVVLASRLGTGLPTSGVGFEFDVITAVLVGGTSIFGGKGKIQGTILGGLIIGILANGLVLLNVQSFYQTLIKGALLLVAVGIETVRSKSAV